MSLPYHSLIPARRGLAVETAEVLRNAITEGRWKGQLPSERTLCRETGVSRPKLREALAILEKEKLLVTRERARWIRDTRSTPLAKPHVVRLLTPLDFVDMQQHEQVWLDTLRGVLASREFQIQTIVRPSLFASRSRRLPDVVDADTACLLLHRSPRHLQQHFVESRVPVLVVGSVYEGIELGSVDIDHRAACRHAVGMLRRAGHNEIYYLATKCLRAGDLHGETGFLEGMKADALNRIVRHDETNAGVCRALDLILRRKPRATAFVVSNSNCALTAVCHLAQHGLIAGRHYAMIARESAPFFDHVLPSIACYSQIPEKMASSAAALIFKLVSGSAKTRVRKKIMPVFVPGDSLISAKRCGIFAAQSDLGSN